jgi:DNA polymerase (family X)
MLSNKEISRIFRLAAQLMELHDENPFKIKSYANAAFKIEKFDKPVFTLSDTEISQLEGIGKSIHNCLAEIIHKGTFEELTRFYEKTPPGVIEMLQIKGIGPKKIATIWKELQVETVGELLYACKENRLIDFKGFGLKTQEAIIKAIEYKISNTGKFHYAFAENVAVNLIEYLNNNYLNYLHHLTGEIRRKSIVLEKIEVLSTMPEAADLTEFNSLYNPRLIPVEQILVSEENFYPELFISSASPAHVQQLENLNPQWKEGNSTVKSEEEIYSSLGLPFIIPEMREGLNEFQWTENNNNNDIIEYEDLKGVLHVHTTYSDGSHSVREMAEACIRNGYSYIGITDHSQAAFYAKGLKPEKVLQQFEEIEKLNIELNPFKIFKGIESDILSTGELDYPEEILKQFDFIIASVHSNLKMQEEKAMQRLLKAIENPYTTMLGHMTGRLLLSREGYPLDHKKIIDACAANNVIIEINANPYRLDMDWSLIPYAMEKGVILSINPDAHHKDTISDMYYGVCAARKGGLTKELTFNTWDMDKVEWHFLKKRK